jgi:hypothetical protein
MPDKNPWISRMLAVLSKHVETPSPLSDAPGMFRCSRAGLIENLLKEAGFTNIRQREINGKKCFAVKKNTALNFNPVRIILQPGLHGAWLLISSF